MTIIIKLTSDNRIPFDRKEIKGKHNNKHNSKHS